MHRNVSFFPSLSSRTIEYMLIQKDLDIFRVLQRSRTKNEPNDWNLIWRTRIAKGICIGIS
jgi:hypothetical protein